jgi:hypothetical protein
MSDKASNLSRVADLLGDYAAVQQELRRLLHTDALLHTMLRVSDNNEWEQTRALKSTVVMLAARCRDLEATVLLLEQKRPLMIQLFPDPDKE